MTRTPLPAERLRDNVDLRDIYYRPSLQASMGHRFPEYLGLHGDKPLITVRDQRDDSHCTGYALAALLDILRSRSCLECEAPLPSASSKYSVQTAPVKDTAICKPVSARMLFEMGRLVSAHNTGADRNRLSIRSTLKGFYHNGVCLKSTWEDEDPISTLTVDRAKDARNIALGTYFRLQQYLPDFHSALAEAEAIVVSAFTHEGWRKREVARHGQIIRSDKRIGAHAFVIIGYDADGFYVLNSWGKEWAGRVPLVSSERRVPGIARWLYEDWADNIIDAWVLRLAVPTPKSFEYSVGVQGNSYGYLSTTGRGYSNTAPVADTPVAGGIDISTPRQTVVGHYVRLEGGEYVSGGSYPDSETSLQETMRYLDQRLYSSRHTATRNGRSIDQVLLRITGDSGSVDDGMRRIAVLRRKLRHQNVYPLSVIWSADLTSAFSVAIKSCLDQAVQRMPEPSDERDDLIEMLVRPVGRPLWQQLKLEAAKIACFRGPLDCVIDNLNATLDHRIRAIERGQLPLSSNAPLGNIDLVIEGTGVLVLIAFFNRLKEQTPEYLRHVHRIHLAFPAARSSDLARAIRKCVPDGSPNATGFLKKFMLHIPTDSFLKNSTIGQYQRTWFHLLNNSFDADRIGERDHRILSIDPEPFKEQVQHFWPNVSCRTSGWEITRQANTESMLRWYMVDDKFLDLIYPGRE